MEAQEKIKQMSIMTTELKNVIIHDSEEEKSMVSQLENVMYIHITSCEDIKGILENKDDAVIYPGGAIIEKESDGLFHAYLTIAEKKDDMVSCIALQLAMENLCHLIKSQDVAKEIKVKTFLLTAPQNTELSTDRICSVLLGIQHTKTNADVIAMHKPVVADALIFSDYSDDDKKKDKKKKKKGKKGKH